eukprot:CAMPEP_0172548156 /NCGR_PEP_ID=MMETSP1067-20121228/17527_1 /TAXON_ID=265564 ORGANISM="Thalassiosira punctigera, Strain Tpunct2005C2" /NCGR_SAMPLE_ID=MMETSP1067 /ASSEMBLY_ACC=CAM_ASM_000444 /LENGTH=217 /DNA_ID=CAMNT_0013335351 /DNA_START=82 /DNA_END=735 /DNA_ORIENTATION=+
MKIALQMSCLALTGAAAGVHAHELRGATMVALAADDSATDKKSADFFPSEDERMDEEGEGESKNTQKRSSAQKRQGHRDNRRTRNNPNRSQRDEDKEKVRKKRQSEKRDNKKANPNDPDYGRKNYKNERERKREAQCKGTGRDCNYRASRDKSDKNCKQACQRKARNVSQCERNCLALDDIDDVDYITDILLNEDVEFIADFLNDVYDDESAESLDE